MFGAEFPGNRIECTSIFKEGLELAWLSAVASRAIICLTLPAGTIFLIEFLLDSDPNIRSAISHQSQ